MNKNSKSKNLMLASGIAVVGVAGLGIVPQNVLAADEVEDLTVEQEIKQETSIEKEGEIKKETREIDNLESVSVKDQMDKDKVKDVNKNEEFTIKNEIKDQTFYINDTIELNLSDYFSYGDKELAYVVKFESDKNGKEYLTADFKNGKLILKNNKAPHTSSTVTLDILDNDTQEVLDTVQFKVTTANSLPASINNGIPNIKTTVADKSLEIDLNEYFFDEDGDNLTYDVEITSTEAGFSDSIVQTNNNILTVSYKVPGKAKVKISAFDEEGKGLAAIYTFDVEIEKGVTTDVDENVVKDQSNVNKDDSNTKPINDTKTDKKLPQTGEATSGFTGPIGILLIGLASVIGFRKTKV